MNPAAPSITPSSWRARKKSIPVKGRSMSYVDHGSGPTVVFLHGNPTSSFLWRDIIEPLSAHVRCIAPDLIGMGDSDKLEESGPGSYRFAEHRQFLDAFLDAVVPDEDVILVIHDWGSALGFDWAKRHHGRVRGIVYMESIVRSMSMSEWGPAERFQRMRSAEGEHLLLEENFFVESILPNAIIRDLEAEEMDEYRRPFSEPGESRRPTLTWPRQMPLDGEPQDVVAIVDDYSRWLSASAVPKLFINADPGSILTGPMRDFCRTWPNQTEVTVPGLHFVQEDSAAAIATAIQAWLPILPTA